MGVIMLQQADDTFKKNLGLWPVATKRVRQQALNVPLLPWLEKAQHVNKSAVIRRG